MISHPYEVILSSQTAALPDWQRQVPCWETLASDAGLSKPINALTVKARYITAIVIDHCRSISVLLNGEYEISTTFFPAYVVFASSIELLGRCLCGDADRMGGNSNNLKAGLKWLKSPDFSKYESLGDSDPVVTTSNGDHTVQQLYDWRNFSAHGQALNRSAREYQPGQAINRVPGCVVDDVDYLVLGELPVLIGNAMEAYLDGLRSNDDLAANLAKAGVIAYRSITLLHSAFDVPGDANLYPRGIGDLIRALDWSYKLRLPTL